MAYARWHRNIELAGKLQELSIDWSCLRRADHLNSSLLLAEDAQKVFSKDRKLFDLIPLSRGGGGVNARNVNTIIARKGGLPQSLLTACSGVNAALVYIYFSLHVFGSRWAQLVILFTWAVRVLGGKRYKFSCTKFTCSFVLAGMFLCQICWCVNVLHTKLGCMYTLLYETLFPPPLSYVSWPAPVTLSFHSTLVERSSVFPNMFSDEKNSLLATRRTCTYQLDVSLYGLFFLIFLQCIRNILKIRAH